MKRTKAGNVLLRVAVAVLLILLVFSFVQIVRILCDRRNSAKVTEQLAQLAVTQTAPPEQQKTEAQQEAEPEEEELLALQAYLPVPIEVDFDALRQENPQIVAWIYCPDTSINHPVVQGPDNAYYLEHMADGRPNSAGAIFLDHRSASALTDDYSIIHGHNMKDGVTMFSVLPNYAQQAYYDAHRVIYLLTPEQNYVLELFAGFVTDDDDGLYRLPLTQQTKEKFIQLWMTRSDFVSSVQPKPTDRLLALSTCAYDRSEARYVAAGVLRPV